MASVEDALTVLERCRVAPPPCSVAETSIPLSFYDLPWITFPPIHQLIFYEFPHSIPHFVETIVPKLKHSLSLTLQHYYPLAGNLIVSRTCTNSSPARKPVFRYLEGDSVPLTIAESNKNFVHFTGHHARDADQFYPLVPHLGQVDKMSDVIIAPLLAVQVTIFPDAGICIGLTSNHVACDGNARVRFIRAWASITKLGSDESFLANGSLPSFDRSLMKDSNNIEALYWNKMKIVEIAESPLKYLSGTTNNVRSSFIVTRAQINLLKKKASAKLPKSAYITSFSVLCAHVWSCLAKMRDIATIGDGKGDDELEQFHCVADYRARLDPPIPETFFGNCLGVCYTTAKRIKLLGDDGFSNAAMLIGEAIGKMLGNKEEMHLGGEMYIKGAVPMPPTMLGVTGSPKFNIYNVDFGFGKAKKVEFSSTDFSRSMSLTVSKESEDDLEIGLSLPRTQMEAFAAIFKSSM